MSARRPPVWSYALLMLDTGAMVVLTFDPPSAVALWQFPPGREVYIVQPAYPRVPPPP